MRHRVRGLLGGQLVKYRAWRTICLNFGETVKFSVLAILVLCLIQSKHKDISNTHSNWGWVSWDWPVSGVDDSSAGRGIRRSYWRSRRHWWRRERRRWWCSRSATTYVLCRKLNPVQGYGWETFHFWPTPSTWCYRWAGTAPSCLVSVNMRRWRSHYSSAYKRFSGVTWKSAASHSMHVQKMISCQGKTAMLIRFLTGFDESKTDYSWKRFYKPARAGWVNGWQTLCIPVFSYVYIYCSVVPGGKSTGIFVNGK